MRISPDGDISFYEDTGTTAKFFWDASAESLGIGDAAILAPISLETNSSGYAISLEEYAGAETWQIGVDVDGDLNFYNSQGGSPTITFDDAGNVGIGTSSPSRVAELYNTSNPALRINNGTDIADIGLASSAGALATGSTSGALVIARSGANDINLATNGTNRVTIDSSGNVGIGTSSPSFTVDTYHATDNGIARFSSGDANAYIAISDANTTSANNRIGVITHDMYFNTNGSERMRIDSSGNLLVGKTSPNGNTVGGEIRATGQIFATASSTTPMYIRRKGDNTGELLGFETSNGAVGSIGTEGSGARLYINQGDTGIGMQSSIDSVIPVSANGGARNNAIDLGYSTVRWKDLYLSGSAYVGDKIIHDGDTDTYLQFHAANQFRIVTGGTEMFEVNDTNIIFGSDINMFGYNIDNVDVVYVKDRITHYGDNDTYITFPAINQMQLVAGGTTATYTNKGLYLDNGSLREDYDALSGTSVTCNVNNGGAFSLTMTGNTTFTFTSPDSGYSTGFVLQLTGNGGTVTWPASVDWAGGTAPDAPASGETDLLVFWTRDGGTTWYGALAIDAAA